jgi:hypothetical protein
MSDTTLLQLLTGHMVRTTSTVQAVFDALKPAALPTMDWLSSKTRTVTSCTSGRSI